MVVKLTASPGHWAQAYPEFYNGGWITGVDQEFSKTGLSQGAWGMEDSHWYPGARPR